MIEEIYILYNLYLFIIQYDYLYDYNIIIYMI